MKQLWIVGFNDPDNPPWEFVGVFDDRDKAVAACIDWRYFVAPATLNETTPVERTQWPGYEHPNQVIVPGHRVNAEPVA